MGVRLFINYRLALQVVRQQATEPTLPFISASFDFTKAAMKSDFET